MALASAPPSAAPSPTEPTFTLAGAVNTLFKLAMGAACVVGLLAAGRWLDMRNPAPPPGLMSWQITRRTSAGVDHDAGCEPAEGWHVEEWPGVSKVAVPDDAKAVRRHYVQSRRRA